MEAEKKYLFLPHLPSGVKNNGSPSQQISKPLLSMIHNSTWPRGCGRSYIPLKPKKQCPQEVTRSDVHPHLIDIRSTLRAHEAKLWTRWLGYGLYVVNQGKVPWQYTTLDMCQSAPVWPFASAAESGDLVVNSWTPTFSSVLYMNDVVNTLS